MMSPFEIIILVFVGLAILLAIGGILVAASGAPLDHHTEMLSRCYTSCDHSR